MFKAKLLTFFFVLLIGSTASAQGCLFQVNPPLIEICPGDSICLNATGSGGVGTIIEQFDFNTSTIPPGWIVNGGGSFGQLCDPSLTGTDYYWSSSSGTINPFVTSNVMDVSLGGIVQFDLDYAVQGGLVPCEGPDLWTEGVHFQYSIDLGATWVEIAYFNPLGTFSTTPGGSATGQTAFTSWATYCFAIPLGAQTTATSFRWIQEVSTSVNFDNWGLDEIVIGNYQVGNTVNWSNGAINTSTVCASIFTDTVFTAYLLNSMGDTLSQNQAAITVFNTTQLTDTDTICPNSDYTFADGTVQQNIVTQVTYTSTFQDVNGCDSLITTTVVPTGISASVTQVDSSLIASNVGPGFTYSWVDCDNGFQAVPGATNQVFTPSQSGNYALIVTENGCSDTSICYMVNIANLQPINWANVQIYPNPTRKNFTIDLGKTYNDVTIKLVNAVGSVLHNESFDSAKQIDLQLDGNAGFYFVELHISGHRFVRVLSKE